MVARVVRVGERWAQLRLAAPVVAARGDRVVLRASTTLGGGRVIDPAPPRHRDAERLDLVARGAIGATVHAPAPLDSLRFLLDGAPEGVERAGSWVFSRDWIDGFERELRAAIEAADPTDPGAPLPAAAWAGDVLPLLPFERRGAKLYLPGAVASIGARAEESEQLVRDLDAAGLRAMKVEDDELARFLEARNELVRLGREHAISAQSFAIAKEALLGECAFAGEITLARFRDLLDVGRRDAQLLLERFDQDGITRRVGDRRVLRRSSAQSA